ncbi:4-coumarate--CoA ligase-like 9 [Corylus avellana]|uniref:4-coumarate--CoA ligase-like 9 n=1 Tax=Corylus avellana TaxID=13451 RepID=UPI00286BA2F7|nr:4-coumarate--CoA ligase-like 9 [Corylus avellana]
MDQENSSVDPRSGFNSVTRTFHSLRSPIDLPPEDTPISAAAYSFSLRHYNSPCPDSLALINSATGQRVFYSDFTRKTQSLTSYLRSVIGLSKGDTAFILSPNLVQVPILYFSLLSLGVVISPANPISTESDISWLVRLCNPVIAFATSSTAHKLPTFRFKTILLDSPEFDSMTISPVQKLDRVVVSQSDLAAIMYTSGTTGKVKGAALTHRNLMAVVAVSCANRMKRESPDMLLYTVPYFHVFGLSYCLKSVALNEAQVVMERFDLRKMLRAVEEFRVTHVALAPPVVVRMAKSDVIDGYDLSSLEGVTSGGAPLGKDVIAAFMARFPSVVFVQGYGVTEAAGGMFITAGHAESLHWGSAGRLAGGFESKIVDPDTGDHGLPPGCQGELWIKGPSIMKGYVGDPEATFATLVADGWLRTGDLCYIDKDGFLFIADRLKELIKYKGNQVPPAELEQMLQSHPEIVDAAVIPYPDEEAGEVPMAFVVRQPRSNLGGPEIMDFVAKQVAPYKKIRRVAFVTSIPKSAAGKILRKDLRKLLPPTSSRL